MERFPSATVRENASRTGYLTFGGQKAGDSSIDFLLGARVDSAWILSKFGTQFNDEVMGNLKKAVYAIGQGGRRWFSGGGELSERQASTILDYLVLVELLLQCRDDLRQHREDLLDCREQLVMQVHRHTEGQPERVAALVNVLVHRLKQQLADEHSSPKPR
jgi:hypothetical protein